MYSHAYPVGAVAAGGAIAATSGWMVLGYVLIGGAVVLGGTLTAVRLRRGRS